MKVGNPLNGASANASHANSSRALLVDTLRVLAGNARLYYEMIKGSPLAGETACAPPSPTGGVGETHTGAPHGRLINSVYWQAQYPIASSSTALAQGNYIYYRVGTDGSWGAEPETSELHWKHSVPVPAAFPGSPFWSAKAVMSAYADGILTGQTYTLTINGVSTTVTPAAATAHLEIDVTIPVVPGKQNIIDISLSSNKTGTGSTVAVLLKPYSLSIRAA